MSTDSMLSTADVVLLQRLQAVAEETRFAILRLLASGERCVCELQSELGAGQSRLSFHLKKLKEAGVVLDRRDGRWVYYRLATEVLERMGVSLGELTEIRGESWQGPGGDPCCG